LYTPRLYVKNVWRLLKKSAIAWDDDNASSMGAAIAYYTLFSIAPILLIAISVAGLVFGPLAAEGEIQTQLQGLMGAHTAESIQSLLQNVNKPKEGIFATIIGFIILIVAATSVFAELQNAFDKIWDAAPKNNLTGFSKLIYSRFLSFSMVMAIAFILMISLIFSAALSAINKWWASDLTAWLYLADIINIILGFLLSTLMFAMIFKILPRVKVAWYEVIAGAVITSVLFTCGKYLIGLYIGNSGILTGYGPTGSLVAMMIWVYYSAQIFLFGAEITWVYSHEFGQRKVLEFKNVSANNG